jgi:hypothetical protein
MSPLKQSFPTVMICDINSLNTEYYVQLLNEANLIDSLDPNMTFYNLMELEAFHKNTTGSYFTAEQKKAMSDLNGLVVSCTFKNKPCNRSHFTYIYDPWLLNCIQFNPTSQMEKVNVGGKHDSLQMELYVGLPNELSRLISKRGARVKLIEEHQCPFDMAPSPKILTPGFETQLRVIRKESTQFNAWPHVYSSCNVNRDGTLIAPIEDTTLFDATIAKNYTYSQLSCLSKCYQLRCLHQCGCVDPFVDYLLDSGYKRCLNEEEQNCADGVYNNEYIKGDFISKNCLHKCPLECHSQRFDSHQSIMALQSHSLESLRQNPMLLSRFSNQTDFTEHLMSNVVRFSVFFDSLSYKEEKEAPKMTGYDLLGSLGGTLHLFLGISLMSAVEVAELLVYIVLRMFDRHMKQTTPRVSTSQISNRTIRNQSF